MPYHRNLQHCRLANLSGSRWSYLDYSRDMGSWRRGTTNSTRNGRGGGGGGGGYSRSVLTVTPLTTYNYTVGAGSTSDAQGGNSWFSLTDEFAAIFTSWLNIPPINNLIIYFKINI